MKKVPSFSLQQVFEHFQAEHIPVFGLDHIVHIAFKDIRRVHEPALYLEVLISHRNILFIYLLG